MANKKRGDFDEVAIVIALRNHLAELEGMHRRGHPFSVVLQHREAHAPDQCEADGKPRSPACAVARALEETILRIAQAEGGAEVLRLASVAADVIRELARAKRRLTEAITAYEPARERIHSPTATFHDHALFCEAPAAVLAPFTPLEEALDRLRRDLPSALHSAELAAPVPVRRGGPDMTFVKRIERLLHDGGVPDEKIALLVVDGGRVDRAVKRVDDRRRK